MFSIIAQKPRWLGNTKLVQTLPTLTPLKPIYVTTSIIPLSSITASMAMTGRPPGALMAPAEGALASRSLRVRRAVGGRIERGKAAATGDLSLCRHWPGSLTFHVRGA